MSASGSRVFGFIKSTLTRIGAKLGGRAIAPSVGIPPLPDPSDIKETKLSLFHDGKTSGALRFEMYFGPPDDPRYIKEPSSRPAIPWEVYLPMGRIAATWGQFEVRMDMLINLLVAATDAPSNIGRLNFRKRKELCRSLVMAYFSAHPDIVAFLDDTLTLAAQAHWRRNLLIHGEIATVATWKVGTSESKFGLRAKGRHNGKDVTLDFYRDDFDKLIGEIAHCYGRLDFLTGRDVNNPMLASGDKQILRDFVAKNLPNLATPPTLVPPQPS